MLRATGHARMVSAAATCKATLWPRAKGSGQSNHVATKIGLRRRPEGHARAERDRPGFFHVVTYFKKF